MYLVCGEALFDCFLHGAGEIEALRFDLRAGGSPFNVAVGISRLGGCSALLTGISNDMLGQRLLCLLDREGVATDYLVRSQRPTRLSLVGADAGGQPAYTFYGSDSADCSLSQSQLPPIGSDVIGLHFGSYSLVVPPVADALAWLATQAEGRFISLDPNVRTSVEPDLDLWRTRVAEYVALADLVKISSEDLAILFPNTAPETKAADWLDAGVRTVVITDGGNDVMAWTGRGHTARISPPSACIVDSVGAGDSFQAAMLARLAECGNPKQAVATLDADRLADLVGFASAAAAITCSRRGADLPRRNDVVPLVSPCASNRLKTVEHGIL